MLFNSFGFIVFLIVTLISYYCINYKYRYIVLLIASYIFYAFSGFDNIFILLFITLLTFFSGKLISNITNKKGQKIILLFCVLLCLGCLLYFKYSTFFIQSINKTFSIKILYNNIVVPLGLSFFTLQAISYPIDVYRKDVEVEKNIFKFALFVSFFPQLLSGPISKSKEMLPQYNVVHKMNIKNMREGLLIILYGFFQKIVIADGLAIGINNVYGNLKAYTGFSLLIIVILYSFQIYLDFMSYSNIALGTAKMFGYNLTNNFNNPYFASSIKEFWSRWHISLSTWFRDYLYFPLGGNRKGKVRTFLNLLIVFLVSGLWHGAAFTYLFWGLIHGIYQIIERILIKKRKRKIINVAITFILVTFAWIFFRANSISDAFYIIRNMFNFNLNGLREQIASIGWDKYDIFVIVSSLGVVFIIDLLKERAKLNVFKIPQIILYAIYFILFYITIIFGYYGPGFDASQFIYLGY